MNKVLFAFLILGTFYTMYRHGFGRAFAWFYLPAILLVNYAKAMNLSGIPNLATPTAVGYGLLMGVFFRWHELRRIRWNLLDTMMVLLLIPQFLSVLATLDAWNAYRETAEMAFRWLVPYFVARYALQEPEGRRATLRSLAVCAVIIGLCSAWEARLEPNKTARILHKLQWDETSNVMVMYRFGLARAIATAGQPIDLGNTGLIVGAMILILVPATGTSWRSPMAIAGILGAGAMVFFCVSFTAWFSMVLAFLFYFLLSRPGLGKYLVVPILLIEITGMVGISYKWLHTPISEERPEDQLEASKWIRTRIIQDAWSKCIDSGWFGFGKSLDTSDIAVGSVDNSYLLFIMRTGWFSLGAFVVFMLVVAAKGAAALGRAQTASERYPAAAAVAGCLAIFFAMYTVFFGFGYAILFCCLVGMLSTMSEMLAARAPAMTIGYAGAPTYGTPVGGF